MGYKIERIESMMLKELAMIIRDNARNPKFQFVSITKVSVTNDLSYATIWFTVLGRNQEEIDATSLELIEARGFLRCELAKKLDLRKTPELRFKYDDSLEQGNKIESILENMKK